MDGANWQTISQIGANVDQKVQNIELYQLVTCFYLKITNNEANDLQAFYFCLFGNILIQKSSFNLQQLVSLPKPVLSEDIFYSFPLHQNCGFFSFLLTLSSKDAFYQFSYYCENSFPGSSL
jgi:hypothetical protein